MELVHVKMTLIYSSFFTLKNLRRRHILSAAAIVILASACLPFVYRLEKRSRVSPAKPGLI